MTRACGTCTLCCKLVPVRELNKGAGERCKHQRATGCRIYADRPPSCRFWSCMWLVNDINGDTVDLRRPDRSHYAIDMLPDFVVMRDDNTGAEIKVPVLQIWCDPAFPNAHRDPELRAFLIRRGREGIGALVRFGSQGRAIALFPPSLASDGEWHEYESNNTQPQHTAAEINALVSVKLEGDP